MTMTSPLKVLCIDIEGGHGGSSRSLMASLAHIDRAEIEPRVVCRRSGEFLKVYDGLGIPVTVLPALPKASALARPSRNLYQLALHARDWARSGAARARLLDLARDADLVHFNHEGLATLAFWLRHRLGKPQTMHIRTNVLPSVFSRAQMWLISRAVDGVVFITANEEATFRSLGGAAPGEIIFNIAEPAAAATPHAGIPRDGRLVVACLSNFDWIRGVDRLVDIAESLGSAGREKVLLAVAGDMHVHGNLPGRLGELSGTGATLADYARERGLENVFAFLGHVPDPERVIAAADLVIKPTRLANPWGRDVIEALAAGKPVISFGSDETFVATGVTGYLFADYDAGEIARLLSRLADDRAEIARLSANAAARAADLCGGKARAADLARFWLKAAGRR